jgi:SAM-dependent methyltransferase
LRDIFSPIFRCAIRFGIRISSIGFKSSGHITRYYMYDHLRTVFTACNFETSRARILSISGSNKLIDLLGLKDPVIVEANYPDHNMLELDFDDNEFDFVVSDQVLEHVDGDPQKAIDESRRVLKPGGMAIHTTCFLNPVHGCPFGGLPRMH